VISYAKCCSNNVLYRTTITEAVEHSIYVNIISVSISRRLNLIWYRRKFVHFQIRNCKQQSNTVYRISRPIRHTLFPKKCDLNLNCVLYAEGKYLFPNLQIPVHLLVTHRVKTTVKMILVAVTMIFWVFMMYKLYYGC
jgi:hypothetical protein